MAFTIISFFVTTILWILSLKLSPSYNKKEIVNQHCADPYIYYSDEKTFSDFHIGHSWYSRKQYKNLRKIHIKTAKEFSGKKTKYDIEMIVRDRIRYKEQDFLQL